MLALFRDAGKQRDPDASREVRLSTGMATTGSRSVSSKLPRRPPLAFPVRGLGWFIERERHGGGVAARRCYSRCHLSAPCPLLLAPQRGYPRSPASSPRSIFVISASPAAAVSFSGFFSFLAPPSLIVSLLVRGRRVAFWTTRGRL
jgi:hypothetical protein